MGRLVLRPGPQNPVREAGEERNPGDEEPVGSRHVDVAWLLLGGDGYPFRHLLGGDALGAPAPLLVLRAAGVVPARRPGRARVDARPGGDPLGAPAPWGRQPRCSSFVRRELSLKDVLVVPG